MLRAYTDAKRAYLTELAPYVTQEIMSENQADLYAKRSDISSTTHPSS